MPALSCDTFVLCDTLIDKYSEPAADCLTVRSQQSI